MIASKGLAEGKSLCTGVSYTTTLECVASIGCYGTICYDQLRVLAGYAPADALYAPDHREACRIARVTRKPLTTRGVALS